MSTRPSSRRDAARDARTDAYARAELRVELGGTVLRLRPRADGRVVGAFPFAAPVYVVTAHNPGPARPGPQENARRQAGLEAELDARGLVHHPTVAGAADGSHAEDGALVLGLDDDAARALGVAWGQDAIFRWSRDAWSILACDDTPPVHRGWEIR